MGYNNRIKKMVKYKKKNGMGRTKMMKKMYRYKIEKKNDGKVKK